MPDATPSMREGIRRLLRDQGRRIAVLDDDPTGSQTVHDVEVVLELDPRQYERALSGSGATCFVLTNSRSLDPETAARLTLAVGRDLAGLQRRQGRPITVVSRSDSTLRGHLMAEVTALDAARREVLGSGYDAVLLVPAYLEAGRYTAGDVHWAVVDGEPIPVGRTEFARDASFGYTSSDLRDWVAERSGGRIGTGDVASLSLDEIRLGGPDAVARRLSGVRDGGFVIANATDYDDLEILATGLLEAEGGGRAVLPRCGPSFVRALSGIEPEPPLTADRIWPEGSDETADHASAGGHGLVVVGSHVGLTTRQVEVALARGGLVEVVLDVPGLLEVTRRDAVVPAVARRVRAALPSADVLLITSREVRTGTDAGASLAIARTVSDALAEVVRLVADASPAPRWVIAKGGITAHDVATAGLGIRRARVLGQLLPGVVSVFEPLAVDDPRCGAPRPTVPRYVVFAGNVGSEQTLADVVDRLRGRDGGPVRSN